MYFTSHVTVLRHQLRQNGDFGNFNVLRKRFSFENPADIWSEYLFRCDYVCVLQGSWGGGSAQQSGCILWRLGA
jgi:hypothetical protein